MMTGAGDGRAGKKDGRAHNMFESMFGPAYAPWKDAQTSLDNSMDSLGGMMGGLNGLGTANDRLFRNEDPPEDTFKTLNLSLKELYQGTTKCFDHERRLRNGSIKKGIRVHVQPGWKDGTKIRFKGLGDEDQDGRAGALVVIVTQEPDLKFQRDGDDLLYIHKITLAEALAGPDPEYDLNRGLKHLDGRNVLFKLPFIGAAGGSPIQPGFEIRIPNRGMPIRKTVGKFGDLRVKIQVDFPAWLNASQILAARQLKKSLKEGENIRQ